MNETVARAMADLVGPMLSQGMALGIAERVAKIRMFREGTYAGEPCDFCGVNQALLDPWKMEDGLTVNLCFDCSGGEAVRRQREKRQKTAEATDGR